MFIRPPADIPSHEITPTDRYLRRRDFLDAAALVDDDGLYWINFRAAREAYDRGAFNRGGRRRSWPCSTSRSPWARTGTG